MTEYIDKKALIEELERIYHAHYVKAREQSIHDVFKAVFKKLSNAPAADVVEVVHGHWISQQEAEAINDYGKAYCCSICGHCDWDCTESESFNYCPHCGAKMDGERRSE